MRVAAVSLSGADNPTKNRKRKGDTGKLVDAKNLETGKPPRPRDPEFGQYGIYAKTAPRAETADPIVTELPLWLNKGDRSRQQVFNEPTPSAAEAEFDTQKNLKVVRIGCMPERMRYTVSQFAVTTGQPVKIVFSNPDATDHNLLIDQPGALEEVGMAANAMEPSSEINEKFQTYQFFLNDGKLVSGVVAKEDEANYHVITNLLIPTAVTKVRKKNLLAFLEAGGYKLPGHLQRRHEHE